MAICPSCGSNQSDMNKFCMSCGAPLQGGGQGGSNGMYPPPGGQNPYGQGGNNGMYPPSGSQNPYGQYGSNGGFYPPAAPPQNNYQQGGYGQNQYNQNTYRQGGSYANGNQVLNTVISKMRTSATIWTIIGGLQIFLGLLELCLGYGVVVIGIGIWNCIQSGKIRKNAQMFSQNPSGIVRYFDAQSSTTIVFLFVNFFLGSFIGIVASIYDITVNSYVNKHRNELY